MAFSEEKAGSSPNRSTEIATQGLIFCSYIPVFERVPTLLYIVYFEACLFLIFLISQLPENSPSFVVAFATHVLEGTGDGAFREPV